jgi:succinate dehydrogenase / fumarate reductase cytochrome b subunit
MSQHSSCCHVAQIGLRKRLEHNENVKKKGHDEYNGELGVAMKDRRPVFFNLAQIEMPVGSLTSIMHRITGILLALGIPFGIYVLQMSLRDTQGYTEAVGLFSQPAFKAAALLFIWALTHHLLAGLRHLLSDIDIGSSLPVARLTAWIVNCSAVLIALLSAGALF